MPHTEYGGEHAALALNYNHNEGYPVPQRVYADNIVDLVDPTTLFWLEELDRGHSHCIKYAGQKLVCSATNHMKPKYFGQISYLS